MTTMHNDAAYEAIFRRYWRRWLALKCVNFLVVFLVVAAYTILMVAASGHGTVITRDVSAIPSVFMVIIGIVFLIGRPWFFADYLDGVIDKRKQRDVTVIKQYLARITALPSFRELEAEMRRRVLSSRLQNGGNACSNAN